MQNFTSLTSENSEIVAEGNVCPDQESYTDRHLLEQKYMQECFIWLWCGSGGLHLPVRGQTLTHI